MKYEFGSLTVLDPDNNYEEISTQYSVNNANVTKEEYDSKLNEFNNLWENTGYKNDSFWNFNPTEKETVKNRESLVELFKKYTPEV